MRNSTSSNYCEQNQSKKQVELYEFTYEESLRLANALEDPLNESSRHNLNALRRETFPNILRVLPSEFIYKMIDYKSSPHAPGVMFIRGLPVNAEAKTNQAVLLGLMSLLGEPFSYVEEKNGEFIHDVRPVQGRELLASNEGSEVDFRFHVETAYFDFRPDFLALMCLRGDRTGEAKTTAANILDALPKLKAKDIFILHQPLFQIRRPVSFSGGEEWSKPLAIISGPASYPEVRVNHNYTRGVNAAAETALQNLEKALNSPGVKMEFSNKPGDLVIINNRKAVHGRTPFKPFYDGADRWLQRIYIHSDVWHGRSLAESKKVNFLWDSAV